MMQNKSLQDEYEWISHDELVGPSPSDLYPLTPLGAGTQLVESLSSYLTRLADAHHLTLSDLVRHVVSPLLGHSYLLPENTSAGSYRAISAMNGRCNTSAEWVRVIEALTLRDDLIYMTFLPYREIVADKGLLRKERAWCPHCLMEWREIGRKKVYEPLLWKIREVTVCLVHQCKLVNMCPHCGRQLPNLAPKILPGHCTSCGKFLGSSYQQSDAENDFNALWIAKSMGELLAQGPELAITPARTYVKEFFEWLITERTKGGVEGLAKVVGVDHSLVVGWKNGDYVPATYNLMTACLRYKVSIVDIAKRSWSDVSKAHATSEPPESPVPRSKSQARINWSAAHARLSGILSGQKKLCNVSGIAKSFRCSVSGLYRKYPALCREVSCKIKEAHRVELKEEVMVMKKQITNFISECQHKGVSPTKVQIYEEIGGRGRRRKCIVKEVFEDLGLD